MLSDEALHLLNLYKGKVLETVTIKAKTKSPVQIMDEKYASGLFRGAMVTSLIFYMIPRALILLIFLIICRARWQGFKLIRPVILLHCNGVAAARNLS